MASIGKLQIQALKLALRQAILDINRIVVRTNNEPVENTQRIDWSDDVKSWAALCDLDLNQHDPRKIGRRE